MLRSLLGFDWRKSKAHLLLLSKLLHPETVDDFAESDAWEAVLGEASKQAIRRFLNEGMLVQADLSAQLDYKYKVNELKDMLKQRGLAVSGRKGDLIQRLVQADPEGMKQIVAGLRILLCFEQCREIAEQYVVNEKSKRSNLFDVYGGMLVYITLALMAWGALVARSPFTYQYARNDWSREY